MHSMLSQSRDIHLSKESLVFQVTIVFILMFQNDSRVRPHRRELPRTRIKARMQ